MFNQSLQFEESFPVVCYSRVSTENQLENYSISEQTDRLNAYCKAKGWKVVRHYSDPGFSGGNTNRPGLRQMLSDLEKGLAKAVVVYKLDRLSRSQKDTLTLIEDEFLSRKIDFVSVLENFDTSTPFGRAMIGLLSVFAQLEKDQITERFRMGRIGRAKAGLFHGGPTAPTGYDYINGQLIPNEYVAIQVREAYDLILAGRSINATQRILHSQYGGWPSAPMLLNVLRNPVYVGKVTFQGKQYDGKHTPIVDKEIWSAVQNLLNSADREDSKTVAQKNPFRANYLLSSLLFCARCGARYSANHGFYKCYSRAKSSPRFVTDPDCKNTNWVIEDADAHVINQVNNMIKDPESLFASPENSVPDPEYERGRLQAEIADLDKQTSRLLDLCQAGAINMDQVSERLRSINEKRTSIVNLLDRPMPTPSETKKEFLSAIEEYKAVFTNAPLERKRIILRSLIRSVEIDGHNMVINWRI